MGGGEEDGALVGAGREGIGACALVVRCPQRRDGKAECGLGGIEEFGDEVAKRVEGEQRGARSSRRGDDRLTEGGPNLWEASLSEDLLDGLSRTYGNVVEERLGMEPDPFKQWTERHHLPLSGKSDGVDRRLLDALGVEQPVNACANSAPLVGNGVVVDRASFTSDTSSDLCAHQAGPDLLTQGGLLGEP